MWLLPGLSWEIIEGKGKAPLQESRGMEDSLVGVGDACGDASLWALGSCPSFLQ